MRKSPGSLAALILALVLGSSLGTPAVAQLGGLKKKLKAAAGATEAADQGANAAAPQAPSGAPRAGGGGATGIIVLTDDVLDRYIAGIRAGEAERAAAAKENTPYGRYLQAAAAYDSAKVKCSAAQAAWPQRAAADEKMRTRYEAMANKMVGAMEKQDMKMYQIYADSSLAIMDASCIVKQPQRPDDWNELQRKVDERAEKKTLEKSGFTASEFGAVSERITLGLQDAPPPDISPSEKAAVAKRKKDLVPEKEQKPAARTEKPAPAPPAPAGPTMAPGQQAMSDCMAKNSQKYKKRIEALGERSKAAQEAGDTPGAIAIADSINQLMMAGCQGK